MSNAEEKPDWLRNYKPDPNPPKAGNPNWKPGVSGNPAGRPPGIADRRFRVTKLLNDNAEKVVRVVIDAALKGDVQSAALVLARIAPAMKAQAERVRFEFDATAPMTAQVQAVLQGIADGEVPTDIGKQIIESISALAGIKQMDELEQQLAALEGK
jgi:hypothetical protein